MFQESCLKTLNKLLFLLLRRLSQLLPPRLSRIRLRPTQLLLRRRRHHSIPVEVHYSLSLVFFGFLISLFTIISDSISFRFVSTHGINLDFGDLSFGFQFWIFLWVLVLFYVECGTQILTHEFSFYAIV